jgi:hypothetical protein
MSEAITTSAPELAHILLYGLSGVRKSTLAAQSPTPQFINLFDSLGNAKPYFENCRVVRSTDYTMLGAGVSEIPMFDCYAIDDVEKTKLIRRILHFGANDPDNPLGIKQFKTKLPVLMKDIAAIGANSYIFDSLTLFTAQARHAVSQWREVAADAIAREVTDYFEDICMALSSLPITTIAISHLSTQGESKILGGKTVRTRKDVVTTAPGRMADRIFGYFSDLWYLFIDEEGNFKVLTQGDGAHIAKNTFRAMAVCANSWQEITGNKPNIIWE